MHSLRLPQVSLQLPILKRLRLNRIIYLLLPVYQIQIPLLELTEYLVHLIGIIEEQVLNSEVVRQVDQILSHQHLELRVPVLLCHVLAPVTAKTRQVALLAFLSSRGGVGGGGILGCCC